MLRWIKATFIIAALCSLPGCFWRRPPQLQRALLLEQRTEPQAERSPSYEYPLTIWIHGTRLTPPGVLESFFYSKPGLHHYTEIEPIYKQRKIAEDVISSDPDYFMAKGFYLFGWSGKLSFEERLQAAHQLYEQLRALRKHYVGQFGHEPIIRIITHSHGGNVALNVARVQDSEDTHFIVDELILLACPVQKRTSCYIDSSLFKKVYSLYSEMDIIQVIDPQRLYHGHTRLHKVPLFSEHCFTPCKKVEQIQINIDQHTAFHIDFIRHVFLVNFGAILHEIKEWATQELQQSEADWCDAEKTLYLYTRPIRTRKRST